MFGILVYYSGSVGIYKTEFGTPPVLGQYASTTSTRHVPLFHNVAAERPLKWSG